MVLITDDEIQMTDYSFMKLCETSYGINRGVFNTIDSMLYERGIKNILIRRKTILSFLEYVVVLSNEPEGRRNMFGPGGLSLKINQFCLVNKL
ncbi:MULTISPECIES: hypothetical protein [unclassified Paenibacillus]|uniref:hypothetical protein n=1 Tax=unclassified Paenibacillus TaxID=185978 RepID=UPI001AEB5865|nr:MULTISPECIES: hypothetical protein [unclassified Paenibacillus]MBP1155362.1 hypothetical protein [Paenibacillus sp. PvP091]MBP1169254.1 hypothetical protein [Paenibacillus sp. PvR098]MBP2440281.1 hypothetical protein [Paenibacillus sp. PvP052]